jgi:uncharacterized membrane protein YvlD (DUF360 family)
MSCAVAIAAWLTDIRCSGALPIFAVGVMLAVVQVIVRPAMIAVSVLAVRRASLPALLLTYFIANVFIFWTIGFLVPGFYVAKFSTALGGSLISSVAGFFIHSSMRARMGGAKSVGGFSTMMNEEIERPSDGLKQAKGRVIR